MLIAGYSTKTDEALYSLYLGGDEAALHVLMERYGNRLTLFICTHIHDINDSEDLMIEAFSRMLAKRPRLREGGFRAYLYKTAHNLALRAASKRHAHLSLDELEEDPEETELIEQVVESRETALEIRTLMEKLNPDYQEALMLVYLEDMSYSQAAKVMGKNPKQIANLVQRGKNSLKTILEKGGVAGAHD